VVGRMSRGWYLARTLGKTHYPSIAAIPRLVNGEPVGDGAATNGTPA
jgi:hypothetical protein